MTIRIIISFLVWAFIYIPFFFISLPCIALLLLTKWDGRTTWFGNAKWGRANDHFAYPTKGYWQEYNWLALRNPINNFGSVVLGLKPDWHILKGKYPIGDKTAGGHYKIYMGNKKWWEYYWIIPYTVFGSKRCVRIRIGWKIDGTPRTEKCKYVFTINPWKKYSGM